MAKLYNGREWKWWIRQNGHICELCRQAGMRVSLGKQVFDETGKGQYSKGYWNSLFQVWLKHVTEYHPWLVKEG